MKIERNKPTCRCVHCGERFTAEDAVVLHRKYTRHVVREHDKPATAGESRG